jgi:hypothetical protein
MHQRVIAKPRILAREVLPFADICRGHLDHARHTSEIRFRGYALVIGSPTRRGTQMVRISPVIRRILRESPVFHFGSML